MTWRAALSLPPEAGAQLEQIGKEMGVAPAVAARILLLEKLRERTVQDRQAHGPKGYDWSGDLPRVQGLPSASEHVPETEAETRVGQ